MMIKEEAAEDISEGRGLPRRTVAASQRRTRKDEACARASAAEMAGRGAKQGESGEMKRRRRRIEAGCCAVTVH